jgi:UTP--glucose-1-phosphate uridylyltransferase
MSQSVRKAVVAAAGFGTRLLPQTKAMPKEMMPIVDKPIIQLIVEQLADAGIEDIIIVTGYHKRSIEDHFDHISADLRANLKKGGKTELLEETKKISDLANFAYVRQKGPYGTATPLLNVTHLIGDEPFIYTFADDILVAEPNAYKQMVELYNELQGQILPCIEIEDEEDFNRYGIVAGEEVREGVIKANGIAEKPGKANATSSLASIGSFLLTPDVLEYLIEAKASLPEDEEFYLATYGLDKMAKEGKPVFGCSIKNLKRYDTGNKLDYMKTIVDFALQHPEVKDKFTDYLQGLNI